MDLRKLKTLIDLVSDSGIEELEVHEGDAKVRIVKSRQPVAAAPGAPREAASTVVAPSISAPSAPAVPVVESKIVTSPMVGTFYRLPAPDKAPYVEIGQTVKASDPVCVIEAMKLLNEIEAGFDGVIREVLVENGQPVEFGQALFVIV